MCTIFCLLLRYPNLKERKRNELHVIEQNEHKIIIFLEYPLTFFWKVYSVKSNSSHLLKYIFYMIRKGNVKKYIVKEVVCIMDRIKLSLDCDWKFHLGRIDREKDTTHGAIYNAAKAGACQGVPQSDFDVSDWSDVQIPHDWSVRQPFSEENAADWGYKSRGTGWYRKSFLLPEEYKERKLVIGFEGVATHCTVYFNGSVVARNYCGYTPFEVDITDMALFGKVPNVLAVCVDAEEWEGWWYEGAGIYRHVWLAVLNPIHIDKDSVFLNPKEMCTENGTDNFSRWMVDMSMEFCNDTQEETEVTFELEMCLAENSTGTVRTQKDRNASLEKECVLQKTIPVLAGRTNISDSFEVENPLIWDIDSPNLYRVTVTASIRGERIDSVETVCGFRTIEMDAKKGFFLNHRLVKLLGTCNHQDFGGLGVAVNDNLWEYRIERLKEMGSNAYRCAHGMPADELIAACDKFGMLVMDENRNYDSTKEGLRQLETLVKRHRNHPSVIMYSIFNEEPLQGTRQGMRMARRMCQLIHKLDPGRLTTGAMNGGVLTEDNAASEVDVCGINYQTDMYDAFHKENPEVPVVATETTSTFGVRGCYETRKGQHEIASYDEDASDWGNTVRETWKAIMEREFVSGGFMWTGFDYLGEPTPHVWPSVSSFFGMMDTCGFPKDGFYLAKAIFSKEPVCHVLPHWNHAGKEGEIIRVMSHTNCEEAELFVNGKSFGRKGVDIFKQVFWEVPYEQGTIELVGYNNGKEAAKDSRTTTGNVAGIQVIPWKEQMRGNGQEAMPVAIIAVDDKGQEVPDANFLTKIHISKGILLGTCNGNPNCHEEFTSSDRSIFNGRCMAVIMPEEDTEKVEIQVDAFPDGKSKIGGIAAIAVIPEETVPGIPSVSEHFLTNWKITSTLFEERPDVNMKMEDFDMNTWQNICVDHENGSPKLLENQQGKYAIYQIRTQIPKEINGHLPTLFFHAIWGECEIYINGKKRAECNYEWPNKFMYSLTKEEVGEVEIRILVHCMNINAGLNSLVVLR